MSRCKHCRSEIRWAQTPSGAAMPLDPNPHKNGNVLIVSEPHPTAHVLGPLEAATVTDPLYMTHFATCPKWPGRPHRICKEEGCHVELGHYHKHTVAGEVIVTTE